MNKTVSINLGGFFFHIDEDAYQKLNRYFDAIRRSLTPDGKDEIMNDIEGRCAELLSEMMKNDKQVVSIREVDEVISVMGQPEDYRIDEDTTTKSTNYTYFAPGNSASRKFYRDGDSAIVAGVCSGIAHYFRIDPLWIRIILVISLFASFGSSLLIYILLWVLIPKAITTTEKLAMTGEAINISNIEKKVREEISTVSEKFQNVDYSKIGNTAKTGAERVGNSIGEIFSTLFKALAKVMGALIVIVTSLALGSGLIMLIFLLFSSGMPNAAWYPYMNIFNYTDTPLWIIGLLVFFACGIPIFFLFLLGLKILINNLKPVGSITGYSFLAIWIISVGSLIYVGMQQASEISSQSKVTSKEEIFVMKGDTLFVKFRNNDYYSKYLDHNVEFRFTQDPEGKDVIYSNQVQFRFMHTDEEMPYVQIEKLSSGNTMTNARMRADKIKYGFEIQGNTLILDNYFLTDIKSKYRNQNIEIYLYVPNGIIIKPDASLNNYDRTYNEMFDPNWDNWEEHYYLMEDSKAKCLNCDEEEKVEEGNSTEQGTIKITNDNVDIEATIVQDSVKAKLSVKSNNNNKS